MKNIEFAAVCLYWYLLKVVSLAADLLAILALLFMIHKLDIVGNKFMKSGVIN